MKSHSTEQEIFAGEVAPFLTYGDENELGYPLVKFAPHGQMCNYEV